MSTGRPYTGRFGFCFANTKPEAIHGADDEMGFSHDRISNS